MACANFNKYVIVIIKCRSYDDMIQIVDSKV